MKHKIKNFILVSVLMIGGIAIFTPVLPVAAQCNQDGVAIGNAAEGDCTEKTAFTFGDCGNTDVGIGCLVGEIMQFLTIAVGIAVVAGITVGGIVYSSSQGNPAGTQKGIKIITNAVLGLILYFLMFAIVNFLVPGGILK